MRRIALCLPTDLESLCFTKVMLKIPFIDGFSFSSARRKRDTGRASLGRGVPHESICNSPGQHLPLPGELGSGASGGTSRCQQRPRGPGSARQAARAWQGTWQAAATAVFGFFQPLLRIYHARGSILSQGLVALGAAQVPAFRKGLENNRLGWGRADLKVSSKSSPWQKGGGKSPGAPCLPLRGPTDFSFIAPSLSFSR